MNVPKLPAETTPFLWGAAAGAIALAIIGFAWGGWVSGATAENLAAARADAAIVAALTPVCVSQFQKSPNARASLAALKETKSWEQDEFVGKRGWATIPGSDEPHPRVLSACTEALNKL